MPEASPSSRREPQAPAHLGAASGVRDAAPLRVLVLSNLYPPDVIGGYELGCAQIVDALRARGHEVRVLTSAPRSPVPSAPHVARELQLGDIWNHYDYRHSHPVTARLLQAQSSLVNAHNVHRLGQTIEQFRPNVVYLWNLVGVGGLGLLAAVQHLGVPWVWHLMDDVPVALCLAGAQPAPALIREVGRQLDGRFLACSEQLVGEIRSAGMRLGERVEVVPNWVTGPAPPPRERFYRADGSEPLRVMGAGQINQNKGIDILIEAVALLRAEGIERLTIDLFGQADDPHFEALTRRRGLTESVRFHGPCSQERLRREYAEHDLFAFPTWAREPFAFAPLEAAWRGCVPLMSQLSGNAEWAVHGVHALKVDRSPGAFAEALAAVLDGTTDLAPLARRAAATVGRDFHLRSVLPRVEANLRAAAQSPHQPLGTADEVYRLALLAEKLARVLIPESIAA